jgi:phosphate transport system substrate-binding protein
MFKKGRIAVAVTSLAMLGILIVACGPSNGNGTNTAAPAGSQGLQCVNGNLAFDGSTALFPLANDVANAYEDKCNGATITPKQSGSSAGLTAVFNGSVAIGNSDIFADPAKYPGLVDHQVAVVVFSVVLNKDVTGVTNLTSQQITDIYTGKIKNWKEVGGPDLPIVTIYRKPGSGTRVTFDTYVLDGATEKTDASSVNADSSGDLATVVLQTSGGIAYVATSYAQAKKLTVIKIDGVNDSADNVKNNTYKFWNVEHMYTKGEPAGLTKAFIDYTKSNNPDVASVRKKNGFIVLSDVAQAALDTKQPK